MSVFAKNESTSLFLGDARKILPQLTPLSLDMVVTSPPYFSLRNYGHEDQLGLESTPREYIRAMVATFRLMKPLLRDEGVFWLNIGDSYARNPAKGQHKPGAKYPPGKQSYIYEKGGGRGSSSFDLVASGLKEKDLIGIPWRLAIALSQPWLTCNLCLKENHASDWPVFLDNTYLCPSCKVPCQPQISEKGWYLRSDVIWQKGNALPNSVKDRPVTDHEYVFLFSKSKEYYFDYRAIQEIGKNGKLRSKRTVWNVNTIAFKGAHFAVFPPDLVTPMILAGSRTKGIVLDPFFGSGTTGIVGNLLNRKVIGIDVNKEYCLLAALRLGLSLA